MILLGSILVLLVSVLAGIMLAVFAAMVISIRRSERRQSLLDPGRGGFGDALTRKVLGVRVREQPACRRSTAMAAPGRRAQAGR